jgi:hypothetical protein
MNESTEPVFTLVVKQYAYVGMPQSLTDEQKKIYKDMEVMSLPVSGTVDHIMYQSICNIAHLLLAVSDPNYGKPDYDISAKLKALINRNTSELPPLT